MLIKFGAKGENVKIIQRALQDLGYDLEVDGDFKNQTYQAVREFQESNGLEVDGKVGENTLVALGLDPATLEPLSTESSTPITLDFEPIEITDTGEWKDTEVPPVMQAKINKYVSLVAEQDKKLLEALDRALHNFETSMSFASEAEAETNVSGSLASTAFEAGVSILSDFIPGGQTAKTALKLVSASKKFFEATTAELEQAGTASESLEVGRWIKEQRDQISRRLVNMKENERNLLRIDLETAFLEEDEQARQDFLDELQQAIQRLTGANENASTKGTVDGTVEEMQLKLYEQWINEHFTTMGSDWDQEVPGGIEYRLEFENDEFEFESCSVRAPLENKVNTALNDLLAKGRLRNIRLPIDLKVRKRVCLRTENHVGGHGWFCAWLDENNNILSTPNHPEAAKGFMRSDWRSLAERFSV